MVYLRSYEQFGNCRYLDIFLAHCLHRDRDFLKTPPSELQTHTSTRCFKIFYLFLDDDVRSADFTQILHSCVKSAVRTSSSRNT